MTKIILTEQEFKTQFIANFLATWTANNYDNACFTGKHEMLHKPPVEDAKFLADKAWDQWVLIFQN